MLFYPQKPKLTNYYLVWKKNAYEGEYVSCKFSEFYFNI